VSKDDRIEHGTVATLAVFLMTVSFPFSKSFFRFCGGKGGGEVETTTPATEKSWSSFDFSGPSPSCRVGVTCDFNNLCVASFVHILCT
jgi:hypothetical protein